jgi:DNA-binding transcriptional LysR family regulator
MAALRERSSREHPEAGPAQGLIDAHDARTASHLRRSGRARACHARASELNLTQSATSAAIAALEHRHAVKLFDRVGRRIVLTDAGRLFLNEARAILARAATGEQVLSDLAGLKRGRLSLAASQTVGNYWLPRKLALFRTRHPGIETPLVIGNTETVAASIHDGLADIGFVEGEIDDPLLAQEAVAMDELAIVVAPGHPWAGRARIDPAEFVESPWVLREPGSGTRQALEAVLAGAGRSVDDLDVLLDCPPTKPCAQPSMRAPPPPSCRGSSSPTPCARACSPRWRPRSPRAASSCCGTRNAMSAGLRRPFARFSPTRLRRSSRPMGLARASDQVNSGARRRTSRPGSHLRPRT